MKTKKFLQILKSLGFAEVRHGRHEVWSNGLKQIAIPSGKEINKMMARRILKELNYAERVSELNYG